MIYTPQIFSARLFWASGGGLSIIAFAPILSNEKWKIENGKYLSPLLGGVLACAVACVNILPQLGEGGRRPDGETSSRREILNNFPLQGGGCHEVTGGGSSRRESFLQQTFSHIFSQTLFTQFCKNFPFSIFNYPFTTKYGGLAHA